MTGRNLLKQWFSTAKKPLQGQFAEWIDSFWHKGEDTIKISDVQNLSNTLAGKVDAASMDNAVKKNPGAPYSQTVIGDLLTSGNVASQVAGNTGTMAGSKYYAGNNNQVNLQGGIDGSQLELKTSKQVAIVSSETGDVGTQKTIIIGGEVIKRSSDGKKVLFETTGKQLSDENYTAEEKTKLAGLTDRFDGSYTSLAALQAAHPTSSEGHEALVDPGSGTHAVKYIWDMQDGWVQGGGSGASTFAQLAGNPGDNAALNSALNSKEPALSVGTLSQYFRGDKALSSLQADVMALLLANLNLTSPTAITAADNLLVALGKLQAQVSAETAARIAADAALTNNSSKLNINLYQSSI